MSEYSVKRPTLAVVGATGAVGTVMLDLLSTRENVWGEIRLVASARSAGTMLRVRGEEVVVQELTAEVSTGRALLREGPEGLTRDAALGPAVERAFAETSVFPAVPAS